RPWHPFPTVRAWHALGLCAERISRTSLGVLIMRCSAKRLLCFFSAVVLTLPFAATARANPFDWKLPSFSSGTEAPAGTPQWWKKHKKQAVFVPGEGYRVEGFEGYYDQEGRPIAARVAKVVKQEKKNGLLHDAKVIESVADL